MIKYNLVVLQCFILRSEVAQLQHITTFRSFQICMSYSLEVFPEDGIFWELGRHLGDNSQRVKRYGP